MSKRLDSIRQRMTDIRATGPLPAVREWQDLAFLLNLLDTKLCKRCKAKIEAEEE